MFKKILVANRGEIACRIISTAKRLGIKTVSVFSEADASSLHVTMADESIFIGGSEPIESYLSYKVILKAIRETGSDAVHPGYGFLSENATFARALAREKITFIGPNSRAIKIMGDKIESKKLATKSGVNTIPGHPNVIQNKMEAVRAAKKIGYPIILKASAGGGGKGMRVAYNESECREGFERATNEARSSFADGRIFIEKYIEEPRHIEIQVLGDNYGNVIYLGERECSIQRRHQKVIEEAPSTFIDSETRQAMGKQAVQLSKAVKYQSAGTVEFIVDKDKNFYFLEMNTRLQVEHPVTELIYGVDLVDQMIRIAAGKKLNITQSDVKFNGWAIESRIYAEDPFRNFLPSIGRITRYRLPELDVKDAIVRVDSGVCEGGEISVHYDPMIAKLIVWGKDRNHAIKVMSKALDGFYIRGVTHNMPFLSTIMTNKRFVRGDLTTNFISEEYPNGFNTSYSAHSNSKTLSIIGGIIHYAYQHRASSITGQLTGKKRLVPSHWVVIANGHKLDVHITSTEIGYKVYIGDDAFQVSTKWKLGDFILEASINGSDICLQVEQMDVSYRITYSGYQSDVLVLSPRVAKLNNIMPIKKSVDTSKQVLSPMPGLLVSLSVIQGQKVKSGEELAVIEAMKMENVIRAEKDCVISVINTTPGESLSVDQVIMEFV